MNPERAAQLVRESDDGEWDEQRSLAVQDRVLSELRNGPARTRPSWRGPALGAVAAFAVAAVLMLFVLPRGTEDHRIQLGLVDGSSVTALDDAARVIPKLVSDTRVELLQTAGSAVYDVAPRAERKFVVHVGDARVEVLGTAFQIDRTQDSIRVAVTRGRVLVVHRDSSAKLTAGEEVTLSTQAAVKAAPEAKEPETDPAPAPVVPEPADEPTRKVVAPSAADLFLRADQARASGDPTAAIGHLRELIRLYPSDGRVTMARFTIGRLEAARGNSLKAAEAFEACGSALAGEAIAEAALARSAAGQRERARALAKRYLETFPEGPRAASLRELAK